MIAASFVGLRRAKAVAGGNLADVPATAGKLGAIRIMNTKRREMMADLPELALAVRQPWAWAIIHAGKNIENRSPVATRYMKHRGRIAIAASKNMTQEEYRSAAAFMARFGVIAPAAADLVRGAIIGSVEVVDVVSKSMSHWWMGPRGLILRDPLACEPVPSAGALGFYAWKPSGGQVEQPLAWMLPKAPRAPEPVKATLIPEPGLFDEALK